MTHSETGPAETGPDDSSVEPPPRLVALLDASLDQIHDGRALAAFLETRGAPCQLLQLDGTGKAAAADAIAESGASLVFIAAGRANLGTAVSVARLLGESRAAVLFGRELSEPALRARVPAGGVRGIIVGEPWETALAVVKAFPAEPTPSAVRALRLRVPGLDGQARREPRRNLDDLPPGCYTGEARQVAFGVPLRTSRGHPRDCLFSAERAWEQPVRRRSVDRIVDDLIWYVGDAGARQFLFTDLVANTDSPALVELAERIIAQRLQIIWHARVWPDPLLDHRAVHLLRRSGCRNLELLVYSGSARLAEELDTGVDPGAAEALVRACWREGIRARACLVVGLPGERDEDRVATLAWLGRVHGALFEISELAGCTIREGAPLRRSPDLAFPRPDPHRSWHDGGDNNDSGRRTWLREAEAWVDQLGIWRRTRGGGFSGATGRGVLERLRRSTAAEVSGAPSWRRRHLLHAGVLGGREAFCGPDEAQLDLVGMRGADAEALLEELARMGTRAVSLGQVAPGGDDVLVHPELTQVLETGVGLGLELAVRTSLRWATPERLRDVAARAHRILLEESAPADWKLLERWIPVVTAARREDLRRGPQVELRCSLSRTTRPLAQLISDAARWGVDELTVELVRTGEAALDDAGRRTARRGLEELLERAMEGDDPLFPAVTGWPTGFELADGDGWRGQCPAGAAGGAPTCHAGDATGRYLRFDILACRRCELLASCPVDRLDARVRLPFTRLVGARHLLDDLEHEDCGLGRLAGFIDQQPCLAGWEVLRIDRYGSIFPCVDGACSEALGNTRDEPLTELWYGERYNEFRRMGHGAAKVMPHVNRTHCRYHCRSVVRFAARLARLERLAPAEREALAATGEEDRLR